MSTDHRDLTEISARTGQTPAEILAAGKMEGEHFPNASEAPLTDDEVDDLLNMVEDYAIQQEALIRTLERKGIIAQSDIDRAIEEIIAEEDEDEMF